MSLDCICLQLPPVVFFHQKIPGPQLSGIERVVGEVGMGDSVAEDEGDGEGRKTRAGKRGGGNGQAGGHRG